MLSFHLLQILSTLQANSSGGFLGGQYIRALDTRPNRVRQLVAAQVLRQHETGGADPEYCDRQFLMMTEWSGLSRKDLPMIDDPAVTRLFSTLNPTNTRSAALQV